MNTDDELDPRNFLRNLYANDNYQKLKENTEKEIVSHAKLEVENKHFLGEMDVFMTDLEQWKKRRDQPKFDARKDESEEEEEAPEDDDAVLEAMVKREEKMLS